MYERKLFKVLEQHLENRLMTVITGMRRVGKTTTVRYLLNKIPHDNKVFIDLERIEHRHIFNQSSYKEIQIELEILGVDFNRPAVIALDEVQLVEDITSVIKYFYDHFEVKFIITGSSSFYLKDRFSESLAGRKRIFEMFPLDFEEYLSFKEIETVTLQKFKLQSFRNSIYLKYKDHYEEYLKFGGFPEVVLADSEDDKIAYLKDVINSFIELDVKLLSDFAASHDLYRLLRLLTARTGSLVDFSKIGSILGISRHKVKSYIELLERTYVVVPVLPFTKNIDRELSSRPKLYLADQGLLTALARLNEGQIFENSIAIQLNRMGKLQYYQRKSGQAIDFIFDQKEAREVKITPVLSDLETLRKRAQTIGLENYQLIGRFPPADGFEDFVWGGQVF